MDRAKRRSRVRRWLAVVCALALLSALCACGKHAETPRPTAAPTAAPEETPRPTAAPTAAPEETPQPTAAQFFGSPWIDSLLPGNVPEQAPEAKDDLYLHCNHAALSAHAGTYFAQAAANQTAVTDDVFLHLADAPDDDAELTQLRIFYRQAEDLDALAAVGMTELLPYLERISAAETLEELNRVLVSEDFPFSPYLTLFVSAYDMSACNNVFVYPHFLFVDDMSGAEYLQESEDPLVQQANMNMVNQQVPYLFIDLLLLGVSADAAPEMLQTLLELETVYGKDAGYPDRYLDQPFGALAAANVNMTLDELAALCPRFPIRETVEKFGKDASPFFTVPEPGWLKTFNSAWNEANLETLKTMTMMKVLHECDAFLDPAAYAPAREMLGLPEPDAASYAAGLCDRTDTFALLIGKRFVEERYSDAEVRRLTELTDALIDAFRRCIGETDWLGAESREAMLQKLDKMRLNVLYPDGGYPDFSGLDLTPAEDGGTLLGNYLKLKAWHNAQQNARLGRDALALTVWDMATPSSANCFYEYDTNSINIMPGFPASQEYGAGTSQEELLGVYGWMIAHEISHAFDFSGAQFDADGTSNSVLSAADLEAYLAIVERLAAYYDAVEALPGEHVVGDRVKTEAAADLIGMQLALAAAQTLPGFDYEAFFRSAAQYMFMALPDEAHVEFFLADEHPLHYLRVNINAQMYPEFYAAYGVQEGDGMYLPEAERIRFWGR